MQKKMYGTSAILRPLNNSNVPKDSLIKFSHTFICVAKIPVPGPPRYFCTHTALALALAIRM